VRCEAVEDGEPDWMGKRDERGVGDSTDADDPGSSGVIEGGVEATASSVAICEEATGEGARIAGEVERDLLGEAV